MARASVLLMFDYTAIPPLWPSGAQTYVSGFLLSDLNGWAVEGERIYRAHWDEEDDLPPSEDMSRWNETGRQLAALLRSELPDDVEVRYHDVISDTKVVVDWDV